MHQVIIYNQDNGIPAVVIPTQEALDSHSIMAIAIKDVPAGKPFKIINASDLPNTPQESWTVDDAELTDGVGGLSNEFQSQLSE
jgi:hypothetical protein